jgi:DNA polymerase-1
MINIHREFEKANLQSKMTIQVHDELVFDVLKSELEIVKTVVREQMMNAVTLTVPLEVEINWGDNWLEAH